MPREMADIAVPPLESHSPPKPIAPPRRKKKSQSLATADNPGHGSQDSLPHSSSHHAHRGSPVAEPNTSVSPKPQRPSLPPRRLHGHSAIEQAPNLPAVPPHDSSGGFITTSRATKLSAARQLSVGSSSAGHQAAAVSDGASPPKSPIRTAISGSSSGGPVRRQLNKNKDSGPPSCDEPTCSDSLKSKKRPLVAQVSASAAVKQPVVNGSSNCRSVKHRSELATSAKSTVPSPEHTFAGKQSVKPSLPPRPSLAPTKDVTVSHTTHSAPPSRPAQLPPAASLRSHGYGIKTAPYSQLYGSTQSLPEMGAVAKERSRVTNDTTRSLTDYSKQSDSQMPHRALGDYDRLLPSKKPPQSVPIMVPKSANNYQKNESAGRDRSKLNAALSHTSASRSRKYAISLKLAGGTGSSKQKVAASSTKSLGGSSSSENRSSPTRQKATSKNNNYSKVPPKRPAPPSGRTTISYSPPKSRKSFLSSSLDSTKARAGANFPQKQKKNLKTFEDHIYMEVGKMSYNTPNVRSHSEGSESDFHEAEYPYVIMTASETSHIYTSLTANTRDQLKG